MRGSGSMPFDVNVSVTPGELTVAAWQQPEMMGGALVVRVGAQPGASVLSRIIGLNITLDSNSSVVSDMSSALAMNVTVAEDDTAQTATLLLSGSMPLSFPLSFTMPAIGGPSATEGADRDEPPEAAEEIDGEVEGGAVVGTEAGP